MTPEPHFEGATVVWLPSAELDDALITALTDELPAGANLGFNYAGPRAWLHVTRPHDTEAVLVAARRRLGRG